MMGGSYISDAVIFLIRTLFEFYILVVMLRFLLQLVRADFYNPISQFLVVATNPPLKPLRRFIPGFGGIDIASLLLMFILKTLELGLVTWISFRMPRLPGLMIWSIAELLALVLYVALFAIFIRIIISWISPGAYNPITLLLDSLTEPLMGPARRILPPVGGLDLSPILILILIQLSLILLVQPITDFGKSLV